MKRIRKLLCVMLSVFLVFFQILFIPSKNFVSTEFKVSALTPLSYNYTKKDIVYTIDGIPSTIPGISGIYYATVYYLAYDGRLFGSSLPDTLEFEAYIYRSELPADIDLPANVQKIPVKYIARIDPEVAAVGILGANPLTTKLKFPDTLKSIGPCSFKLATGLKTLELPASVDEVGKDAFTGCSALTQITVYNPNCKIHSNAFDRCDKLTKIYGYSGSTAEAFAKKKNLEFISLGISETTPVSTTLTTATTKVATTTTKTATIATTVPPIATTKITTTTSTTTTKATTIATTAPLVYDNLVYSFSGNYATVTGFNSEIQNNVEIPQKVDGHQVTAIAASAFRNCTNLESIKIPNSVTEIGANAFYICTNLNSVTILNPYCTIDKNCKIPGRAVIYGYSGSTAQEFAETNGNEFVALDAPATTASTDSSDNSTETTVKVVPSENMIDEVVKLVNEQREANEAKAVVQSSRLNEVAKIRAEELIENFRAC